MGLPHSHQINNSYLFYPGCVAAEAAGPCRREIASYLWRLYPGQGSGVTVGGGGGAADQQSRKETGSLLGSVWALLSKQVDQIENSNQPATIQAEFPAVRFILTCL